MNLKLYETTLNLTDSTRLIEINSRVPLNLTVNPFNMKKTPTSNEFDFSSKISKIVYDWGDGVIETQKAIPASFSDPQTTNYPFVKEKGDPRNFIKTHIYNFSSSDYYQITQTFEKLVDLNVYAYMYGVKDPITYKFRIRLSAPRLDGSKTGFFKNFHLIYTKMFDLDNKILYVFEGKDPSWIFPVLVDWRKNTVLYDAGQELIDYNKFEINI
jgi:hypothetical protein